MCVGVGLDTGVVRCPGRDLQEPYKYAGEPVEVKEGVRRSRKLRVGYYG